MASRASGARQTAAVQTSASATTAVIQRQCACGQHSSPGTGECDQCKKKRVSLSRHAAGTGPVSVDSRVRSALQSPGQPLEKETQSLMESRFQHNFSSVRVHTGSRAEESARALQANAYALGRDVVFGQGRYNPSSEDGLHLIAHELAHVVQQQHAPAPGPQTDLEVSEPGDAAEREAESAADQVAAGGKAGVYERAGSAIVHREFTKTDAGAIAIGAAVVASAIKYRDEIGHFFQRHFGDATDIKAPPKCGYLQKEMIRPAISKATATVKSALTKIHAFQANPNALANKYFKGRLGARFNSDSVETVTKIEQVVSQVARQLAEPSLVQMDDAKVQCQTAKSDITCSWADAYVPGDGSKVVLCTKFFKTGADPASLVHEMVHATTGGAPIIDRGYQGERILPLLPKISTDAALTNAESYSEFVSDIVTGTPVSDSVPNDDIECPQAIADALTPAVAQAERWNTNALTVFSSKAQGQKRHLRIKSSLPRPVPLPSDFSRYMETVDFPRITSVYRKTNGALGQPLRVVCQDANEAACAKPPEVQFHAGNPTLYVCSGWTGLDNDHQVVLLLAAIYGSLGGETDPLWQTGLANIALAVAHNEKYTVPSHQDVIGDAAEEKAAGKKDA